MKLWKKDLLTNILKFTQGIFDIYYQSKDTADFRNLHGKLEPATSNFTANGSKLIEEYFLDLRNMFPNQENIKLFFSKQEK